jgi:predicted transposase YbfD/YdcC
MLAAPPRPRLDGAPDATCSLPALVDFLGQVPEHRSRQGLRHPLPAVLALMCAAVLGGANHPQAMAEWGRELAPELVAQLGFTREKTPCPSTFHEVLKGLHWEQLEQQLRRWVEALLGQVLQDPQVALAGDGKVLRGSRKKGCEMAHLLSVVVHDLGITLSHEAVAQKSNEIPALPQLLGRLILHGRVLTVDALHTQRELAQALRKHRAHYVMIAKRNQPELLASIARQFDPADTELAAEQDREVWESTDYDHGRQERRRLLAVSVTDFQVDWPGVEQVFRLERTTIRKRGEAPQKEVVYGLTSLRREQAGAKRLLQLNRGHWTIENRVHWVRDREFGEDASQTATGEIARVLAAVRTTVITILRATGKKSIAAARRRLRYHPRECIQLIGAC